MRHDPYLALRESAAVIDLTGRGHLQASGEDRHRFLHAMTSNHVESLQPGGCRYAFFLNSQGKILADVNLICTESSLLLDVEPEAAASLYEHLERYIIADDVTLSNQTAHVAVLGVEGPQSPAVLERMGIDAPAEGHWVEWRTWAVAALSATGERGFRFFVPRSEHEATLNWILGSGAVQADRAEWNAVRLENGRPRYGEDFSAREIPHETNLLDRAISFNKGCYVGQEIVERVRSRGRANRLLVRLAMPGPTPPAPGAKLRLGEQEVGEITSAAYSPAMEAVCALGFVRAQTMQPEVRYAVDGGGLASLIEPRSS